MVFNILWLQSGGCGGCSLSLLGAESPDLNTRLDGAGINLLWHPMLSEASGPEMLDILSAVVAGELHLDAFCLEGAVLRGPNETGRFHLLSGTGRSMMSWVQELAAVAQFTIGVGTGAAVAGITRG